MTITIKPNIPWLQRRNDHYRASWCSHPQTPSWACRRDLRILSCKLTHCKQCQSNQTQKISNTLASQCTRDARKPWQSNIDDKQQGVELTKPYQTLYGIAGSVGGGGVGDLPTSSNKGPGTRLLLPLFGGLRILILLSFTIGGLLN